MSDRNDLMAIQPKTYTSEEFWEFLCLPENRNKLFERVRGQTVERSFTNGYTAATSAIISSEIVGFDLKQPKRTGWVTGAKCGHTLANETTYNPSVAYTSRKRVPKISPDDTFMPVAPDLAVEVYAPENPRTRAEMAQRAADFLGSGTQIVWNVYPIERIVIVHTSEGARTLTEADTLDGGDVLPGFTLPVRDIFPGAADL